MIINDSCLPVQYKLSYSIMYGAVHPESGPVCAAHIWNAGIYNMKKTHKAGTKAGIVRAAALITLIALAFTLTGCVKDTEKASIKGTAKIGSECTTESVVVAEIYRIALEKSGYKVIRTTDIATGEELGNELFSKNINLYPGYTNNVLRTVLKYPMEQDPETAFEKVSTGLEIAIDATCLDTVPADSTPGIAITKAAADKYGIRTISDLKTNAGKLIFAKSPQADGEDFDMAGLSEKYGGFSWSSETVVEEAKKYRALLNGEADCCVARGTDGYLREDDIVLLEDDLGFWPSYKLMPVVSNSLLTNRTLLGRILNYVDKGLTTEVLRDLNAQCAIDGKSPEKIAEDYYNTIKDEMPKQ